MILVQKPSIPQSPLYTYKRHPPASNVVMFPTRTPGLLTFSNSPRPPLQRKPLRKSKSTAVVRAPLLNLPAETTDNKKSGVIALPARGGRGQTKHTKDKVQNRRSDPSSPSPPSRKSANHQQHTPSSPVHSGATPVSVATRPQSSNISHSDSLPSHIQRYPIRDDMNDPADLSAPTTPLATRRNHHNYLHSTPISSRKPGPFPSNTMSLPSSPSLIPSKRKHRRTRSKDVFQTSSDEDHSSGPDGTSLNPNVRALFGLVNTSKPSSKTLPSTPIRAIPPYKKGSASSCYGSSQSKSEVSEKAADYFASSMFQNSPSPDELPDPLIF